MSRSASARPRSSPRPSWTCSSRGCGAPRLERDRLSCVKAEDSVVESLRKALRGRRDVRLALLFGSRARGRARPDSDADVAVLGKDLNLLALASDLSEAVGIEVDVVSLTDPGYPLLNALLRDSIVLHEGERHSA